MLKIPVGGPTSWEWGVPTLVLEGSNLTEGTTTSTSEVDLLAVGSLSIAVTKPILIICNIRKSAGSPNGGYVGLKLNDSVVIVADDLWASNVDEVASAVLWVWIGPRVAGYERAGVMLIWGMRGGGGTVGQFLRFADADMPIAVITDVAIRGKVANPACTQAADDLRVYSLAV